MPDDCATQELSITPVLFDFTDRRNLPRESGIYAALVNGVAMYVGQSMDIRRRWQTHDKRDQCVKALVDGDQVQIAYWLLPKEYLDYCEAYVRTEPRISAMERCRSLVEI